MNSTGTWKIELRESTKNLFQNTNVSMKQNSALSKSNCEESMALLTSAGSPSRSFCDFSGSNNVSAWRISYIVKKSGSTDLLQQESFSVKGQSLGE